MASHLEIDPSWVYLTSSREEPQNTHQHCPIRPYLSLHIPRANDPATTSIVRRIVFTMVSHDQGFSNETDKHGTYQDSQTWFDANVIDSSGLYRVPRLLLQHNVHARWEATRHVKAYDFRDEADEGFDQGSSEAWLSAIKCGDTIQLVPRALWPAWVNWVIEARIEVWAETVAVVNSDRSGPDDKIYRPLHAEEREIRVVAIERGRDDEPPRLSLHYTSLSRGDRTLFNALSYCWGEATNTTSVALTSDVDGTRVSSHIAINANLLAALKRLRRKDADCFVWIDLICIKQSDTAERSQQVAMMGDIFSSADHVYIWLGLEQRIASMGDIAVYKEIASKFQADLKDNKPVDRKVDGMDNPIPTHRATYDGWVWYNFHHTRPFSLPWFHRVWVLQEAWSTQPGAAIQDISERVSVLCGSEELPWAVFIQVNHCIHTYYGKPDVAANMMPEIWKTLFHAPRDTNPFFVTPVSQLDILEVAVDGLDMRATDARDKIFALLVFGKETHNVSGLPDLVRPDYRKSVAQVYADFTRWWIGHSQSLRILSAAQTQTGRTWLDMTDSGHGGHGRADLSRRPSWSFWHEGRGSWKRGLLGLDERMPYNASAGRDLDTALLLLQQDGGVVGARTHVLALRGLRLGCISSLSYYPLLRSPAVSSEMQTAYLHIFGIQSILPDSHRSPSTPHIMDHHNAHAGLPPSDPEAIPDCLPCHGKCMFSTRDGLIGLRPSGAEIGDIVVVLYGARVPSLLRPTLSLGEYFFVGECYADGVMHGECFASDFAAGQAVEPETFLLV